jgi:Tol biopolymer transport system component
MIKHLLYLSGIALVFISCNQYKQATPIQVNPAISPDYANVTIPCNIAPLNFAVTDKANDFILELTGIKGKTLKYQSTDGNFKFSLKQWKRLLAQNINSTICFQIYRSKNGRWEKYLPFSISVSSDSISPYIAYRTIDPGNIFWKEMSIDQRCIENFNEWPIVDNTIIKKNCINCHSFSNYNPDKFLFHMRKYFAGTLIDNNGQLSLLNTKTAKTMSNATYPSWHPSGKFIAFSVNKIHQQFFSQTQRYEVVQDEASDIILYDLEQNKISTCPQLSTSRLENLPAWAPDGKTLYYISGNYYNQDDYKNIKYDLLQITFDPATAKWGKVDTLLTSHATGKSFSFPSVSPDGKFLLFCVADYGYFTIHNNESDIYIMDLSTKQYHRLASNSEFTESYPTWSQNSKWIMFVSKRNDDMFSRPWFSHINNKGEADKPFILPQKDPCFYNTCIVNFNRPEFISGKVKLTPHQVKEFVAENKAQPVSFDSTFHTDGISGATAKNRENAGVNLDN